METEIFSRQISFFGIEGQERLAQTKVGIIGLGGTGSQLFQQLAYLGLKKFILIDKDNIEKSNFNRQVCATLDDIGKPKITVASKFAKAAFPNRKYQITEIQENFPSDKSLDSLKTVDLIFGCVDKDGPRLVLTEYALAYKKTYIDLATEIHPDFNKFGGRVFFTIPGKSCLHCRNELDSKEIRKDLSNATQAKEDDEIYGLRKEDLKGSGPSVVSINGAIASLAVTEFIVFITGIREPKELLIYDGLNGIVKLNKDKPDNDCYYCKSVYGIGDRAKLDRYVTN